jgi:hypothetical protein
MKPFGTERSDRTINALRFQNAKEKALPAVETGQALEAYFLLKYHHNVVIERLDLSYLHGC